jgi:hypothetical protein
MGYPYNLTGQEMRDLLAANALRWTRLFQHIDPTGSLALQTCAEIKNVHIWGGEPQIRIAAEVLCCRLRVHTLQSWSSDYGENGPLHHLLYHNRVDPEAAPNHYDFLDPIELAPNMSNAEQMAFRAETAANSSAKEIPNAQDGSAPISKRMQLSHAPCLNKAGSSRAERVIHQDGVMSSHTNGHLDPNGNFNSSVTAGASHTGSRNSAFRYTKLRKGPFRVITVNIGGSRDAFEWICTLSADVILVQEHKLDQKQILSQSKRCLANGWKGVWTPAAQTVFP